MGVSDSVTLTLVNATPYSLQYLMQDTGQPGSTVLQNNPAVLGPTPNMANDILQAANQGGSLPLSELLATTCVDVAEARHLLLSDGTVSGPDIASVRSCRVEVTPRVIPTGLEVDQPWAVDARLDPAAPIGGGRSALDITPPGDGVAEAYLYISLEHSMNER